MAKLKVKISILTLILITCTSKRIYADPKELKEASRYISESIKNAPFDCHIHLKLRRSRFGRISDQTRDILYIPIQL